MIRGRLGFLIDPIVVIKTSGDGIFDDDTNIWHTAVAVVPTTGLLTNSETLYVPGEKVEGGIDNTDDVDKVKFPHGDANKGYCTMHDHLYESPIDDEASKSLSKLLDPSR